MRFCFFSWLPCAALALCQLARAGAVQSALPAPKVMIVNLFVYEANVWYKNMPDLLAVNVSVPGLSPIYPDVHCTANHSVCQLTLGEGEINAASTLAALVFSSRLALAQTYFLISGIAGVSPKRGPLGAVALARFSVSVALQYELDARDMPDNFTTGYFSFGTYQPNTYPDTIYGSEVFEVNEALRDLAFELASKATLANDAAALAYGRQYASEGDAFAAAGQVPLVIKCDTATSDVYYSGTLLSEAFENITAVWTNGSALYCMTNQEDTAALAVLMRGAVEEMVDFSRIVILRTASDFDRPPPGMSAYDHLLIADQNGFEISIANIYRAGVEIVRGILRDWDCTYAAGIAPTNYIGDIFGSLGGFPNFGPGSITNGSAVLPAKAKAKRAFALRSRRGVAQKMRAGGGWT